VSDVNCFYINYYYSSANSNNLSKYLKSTKRTSILSSLRTHTQMNTTKYLKTNISVSTQRYYLLIKSDISEIHITKIMCHIELENTFFVILKLKICLNYSEAVKSSLEMSEE